MVSDGAGYPTRCFLPAAELYRETVRFYRRGHQRKISATRGAILLRLTSRFRAKRTFCAALSGMRKLKCWKIIPIRCRALSA